MKLFFELLKPRFVNSLFAIAILSMLFSASLLFYLLTGLAFNLTVSFLFVVVFSPLIFLFLDLFFTGIEYYRKSRK